MVKVICVKDSTDWLSNKNLVKKGQIVLSDIPVGYIATLRSLNNKYLGIFKTQDFIRLDESREQQISKILKND